MMVNQLPGSPVTFLHSSKTSAVITRKTEEITSRR